MLKESVILATKRMAEIKLKGGQPAPAVERHLRLYLLMAGASELERDVLAVSAVRAVAEETPAGGTENAS